MSECNHPVTHINPDGSVECLICGETLTKPEVPHE